ncbi:hypothetical protein [Polaromonas aquatica]|uniref:hypothetical protein n=1 Tax=Polaromonas aquatica TaxID=332657 RepID=UPI003D6595D8
MNSKTTVDPKSDRNGRKQRSTGKPDAAPTPEYGREGTNRTIPQPKADNAPSEELGNTPHVGKTPYTRG